MALIPLTALIALLKDLHDQLCVCIRGGRLITWDDFRQDFRAHHIPQSVVESKRQEFRNLKQGSLSVYDYNKLFQKLARFAKQDVPDEKSMIYQFSIAPQRLKEDKSELNFLTKTTPELIDHTLLIRNILLGKTGEC